MSERSNHLVSCDKLGKHGEPNTAFCSQPGSACWRVTCVKTDVKGLMLSWVAIGVIRVNNTDINAFGITCMQFGVDLNNFNHKMYDL